MSQLIDPWMAAIQRTRGTLATIEGGSSAAWYLLRLGIAVVILIAVIVAFRRKDDTNRGARNRATNGARPSARPSDGDGGKRGASDPNEGLFETALIAGDAPKARALFDALGSPRDRNVRAWNEAKLLVLEGRFADALAAMGRVDRALLGAAHPFFNLQFESDLGAITAQAGDGDTGVRMARDAFDTLPADFRVIAKIHMMFAANFGIALAHVSSWERSVRLLQEAVAVDAPAGATGVRELYLADGLKALGRTDEALAGYERAARLLPDSYWGTRARAGLEQAREANSRG